MLFAFVMLIVCFTARADAEIYLGITPYSTLGDLKEKFPAATFERAQPAWAQEDQVMYRMSGTGIPGRIVVMFNDVRPSFRRLHDAETDDDKKQMYADLLHARDDLMLEVLWVRWVPEKPFPVQRLITKYGKPNRSGFSEGDFRPYKRWTGKAVTAALSDDGKEVLFVDFNFTRKELRDAFKKKFGYVPKFLKVRSTADPRAQSPPASATLPEQPDRGDASDSGGYSR